MKMRACTALGLRPWRLKMYFSVKWHIGTWAHGCSRRLLLHGLVAMSGHCYGLLRSCKSPWQEDQMIK